MEHNRHGGQDTPALYLHVWAQQPSYRAFVFDTAGQKPTIEYALAGKVQSLALTRDGRFLVAGDAGAARVWDLYRWIRAIANDHRDAAGVSGDQRRCASGRDRGCGWHHPSVRNEGGFEIARVTMECPAKSAPTARTCGALAAALSPDGRLVFSAGDDGMLRVFESFGASDEARSRRTFRSPPSRSPERDGGSWRAVPPRASGQSVCSTPTSGGSDNESSRNTPRSEASR